MSKSINPMDGVVNPDLLVAELKKLKNGSDSAKSYVRGALNYLSRTPPNKLIVPLLQKALEKYG